MCIRDRWEAIETYMDRKQPLIIVAGADYGQGSSRDWAAKGVRLAGVEAIAAEGFERIHRTNLIGMGVLPLEFKPGVNRKTLGLDGTESYDVVGERKPRADLTLVVHRRDGETLQVPMTCRLDTAEEVSILSLIHIFIAPWLEQLSRANLAYWDNPRHKRNNHYYWTGVGIMATALATRDAGLLRTAQAIYRKGIDDIQADGSLPMEMARGARALHYHDLSLIHI